MVIFLLSQFRYRIFIKAAVALFYNMREQKLVLLLCTKIYKDTFILYASCVEYLVHVAKLNQLLVLSQQLEEDIRHLGSHKYITHQLSVIYVSNNPYNAMC